MLGLSADSRRFANRMQGKEPGQCILPVQTRILPLSSRVTESLSDAWSSLNLATSGIAQAERAMAASNARIGVSKSAFFPAVRLT